MSPNTQNNRHQVSRAFMAAGLLLAEYSNDLDEAAVGRLQAIVEAGVALKDVWVFLPAELAAYDELAAIARAIAHTNAAAQDPVLESLLVSMAYNAATHRMVLADGGVSIFGAQVAGDGLGEEASVEITNAVAYLLRARAMEQLIHWGCAKVALSIMCDVDKEDWLFEQGRRFFEGGNSLGLAVECLAVPRGLRGAKMVFLCNDGEGYARPVVVVTKAVFAAMEAGDPRLVSFIAQMAPQTLAHYFEEAPELRLAVSACAEACLEAQLNHLCRVLFETDLQDIPVLLQDSVGDVDELVALLIERFSGELTATRTVSG